MKVIHLGNWVLNGTVLTPTKEELQTFCKSLSFQRGEDPMVTFRFADSIPSETSLQIQRSLLVSCGGPLASLVSVPFLEARENVVNMPCESRSSFEVIRRFVYCLSIDLAAASAEIPLVADRWEMRILFKAYFLALEEQDLEICQLCDSCFPAMATVQVPDRFKKFFMERFSSGFAEVQRWLGRDVWQDEAFRIPVEDGCPEDENTGASTDGGITMSTDDETTSNQFDILESSQHDSKRSPRSSLAHSEGGNDRTSIESKSSDTNDETDSHSEFQMPRVAPSLDEKRTVTPSYWSSQSALLHAKRNLWNVLMFQGLAPQILKKVALFSSTNLTEQLLDVVLRQLEGKLSDGETIQVLRLLDWDSVESSAALLNAASQYLSVNAWKLLARAQTGAIRRGCDTVSHHWTMLGFHGRLPEFRTGTYWYKEIGYKRCIFRIRVGKPSSKKCQSNGVPNLVFAIGMRNCENVPAYYLDRGVTVQLHVTGTHCKCRDGEHSEAKIGMPLDGKEMDKLTIGYFVKRNRVNLQLMTAREFERFLQLHKPSCGIVMKLRLRIDDYKARNDPKNDEFGGEAISGEDKSGIYTPG